ncbi:hypothetical protein ACVWWG_007550 [Bradyrhizobium sp. LB7.2]
MRCRPPRRANSALFQPRNGAEDALLLPVFQLRLKADDVVERAELVVLAQLHDCVGFGGGIVRIGEADRLHRPVAQGLGAALRHHLDRQTAVEIGRVGFPFLELGLLAGDQRGDEAVILLLGHRAVDVVGTGAAGTDLVVARLEPCCRHVDGFAVHDRRDRVEEGERVLVGQLADGFGQRRRGEGTSRNDDVAPLGRRQACNLVAGDLDQGVVVERLGDGRGEAVAIDRQRTAGGHLVGVGRTHDQRVEAAHLGMKQADGVVGGIIRAERVGADELGKSVGAVCLGHAGRPHLVQHHGHAGFGHLPGGFGAGKACADDVHGIGLGSCHGADR